MLMAVIAATLAACSSSKERGGSQYISRQYKQEIPDTLSRTLIDPTNVRDAFVSDPALTPVGKDQRYTACVRLQRPEREPAIHRQHGPHRLFLRRSSQPIGGGDEGAVRQRRLQAVSRIGDALPVGTQMRLSAKWRRDRLTRRAALRELVAARQQRRDAAHGDAPISPFRRLRRNLEVLLAVTLRRQVFRRNAEILGQDARPPFLRGGRTATGCRRRCRPRRYGPRSDRPRWDCGGSRAASPRRSARAGAPDPGSRPTIRFRR